MVEEFLKYTDEYDHEDDRIKAKVAHTMRVRDAMIDFATKLNFDEEEIELAGTIGLLHDIGRFDQAKMEDSFNDLRGFDHAEYGADLLFKDGLIRNYIDDPKYDNVIEFAIRQHNKLILENCDDELSMKMAKLIRDVDKLDILYNLGTLGRFNLKGDDSPISKEVLEDIKNRRPVDRKNVVTNNDKIIMDMAFVLDLNYDISIEPAKEWLKVLYDRVEYKDTFKSIYEDLVKYLDERID